MAWTKQGNLRGPQGPAGVDGKTPVITLNESGEGVYIEVSENTGGQPSQVAFVHNGEDGEAGPQGPQGPQGPSGSDGEDGLSCSCGSGAPSGSAKVGDSYIDYATGDFYEYV